MNILVACEESQRVCIAFRDRGHNAFSCDLQDCSGGHPEWHIKGDVNLYLNPLKNYWGTRAICFYTCDEKFHHVERWDMIIAHPPCTYFCLPGACHLFPNGKLNIERYKRGLEMKSLFLKILNADCDKICIENPTPMKIWQLPKPSCIIQPYEFGAPYSKRTLLWLKGLPPLLPTTNFFKKKFQPWVNGGGCKNQQKGVATNSKDRSKTFWEIARAMAEQWG